jgi:tellurite resistance protein TerC
VILAFIGVKLIMEALHTNELPFINGGEHIEWAPDISTWTSLAVIIGAMAVATVASLAKANLDARRRGHTLGEEIPHFTEEGDRAERAEDETSAPR